MAFDIKTYRFQKPVTEIAGTGLLSDHIMGTNWPVVYILHGNRQVYVGETSSAAGRMEQHLDPCGKYIAKRRNIDTVEIVFDPTFNKSAILDIENTLISLFRYEIIQVKDASRKSRYFSVLQNGNSGQSKMHNYYQRARYQEEVEQIWEELRRMNLATNSYQDIVNDKIFKFSPYTALNEEQREVCLDILNNVMDALYDIRSGNNPNADFTAIVNGVAGTGKTIVLLNMLTTVIENVWSNKFGPRKTRSGMVTGVYDNDNDDAYESAITLAELTPMAKLEQKIEEYAKKYGKPKIAYVAQMTSLRDTIAEVISEIPHLRKKDAMGPSEIVKETVVLSNGGNPGREPFDIIFVDEAHRLCQYNGLSWMGPYKRSCEKLYGPGTDPATKTTLDWIFDCSRTRVLVYDGLQTVKESDITPEQFKATLSSRNPKDVKNYFLKQQMRCRAGMDYISYLDDIFACRPSVKPHAIDGYELRFFDDANALIKAIVTRDGQVGLSKTATGYGWQWKKPKYDECNRKYNAWIKATGTKDTRATKLNFYLKNLSVADGLIDFGGTRYVRNLDYDWLTKGDPREIGCIHTSQGFDLNYVGVLFGPEIDYVKGKGIVVDPKQIRDTNSVSTTLKGLTPAQQSAKIASMTNYVLNAYKVMMERGIRGCYVYAHNEGLRNYLKQFFAV